MSKQVFRYHEAGEFDFSNTPIFRKTAILDKSQVRVTEAQQEITTVIDGREETRNTADVGDYIITGVKGEKYVIKAAKFPTLYEEDPSDSSRYISKNIIHALVLTENTELTAPWGEKQHVEKGGVIVQRVDNPQDIYLIEKGVFEKTYIPI